MIDPTRGALYRQIADAYAREIANGDRLPGSLFPSIPEIAHQYRVGRHTAREVLQLLERRGLVVVRQGHGTRVRDTHEVAVHEAPPGHEVGARMPTEAERLELDIPGGVPLLVLYEVVSGAEGTEPDLVERDVWPADRARLRT